MLMTLARRRMNALRARRFRADEKGATAVEFALIAAPFFFMMFAILELGLVFVLNSTLETATISAGRLIRTGQTHESGASADTFRDEVCSRMSIFAPDCASRLRIDVRVMPRFADNPPDPTSDGSFNEGALVFNQGEAGDIILVRSWYSQPLMIPYMWHSLSRFDDGSIWLTAATAFRNEPF